MKCEFCGEELQKDPSYCDNCQKEQTNAKETTETSAPQASVDAMPALHDELNKIGEMRQKAERRKGRVLLAVLIVLFVLAGSAFGVYFFNHPDLFSKPVDSETNTPVTSGVPGEAEQKVKGHDFTDVVILDEVKALDAVNSMRSSFGITDTRTEFVLEHTVTVGEDTYYRFAQYVEGMRVYGGEMVICASRSGQPLALSGYYIATDGLDMHATLDVGEATNAMNEYVNRMTDALSVKEGIYITAAQKVICNFDGITYLAYTANVSGYNADGEYVAYDVFLDADAGTGLGVCHTASYENETVQNEQATTPVAPIAIREATSAADSLMKLYVVNDKFNWNDKTKTSAVEEILMEEIAQGNTSLYVTNTKKAVDKAYSYFKDRFAWRGLDGKNGAFSVYLNSNEYVKEKLPPDSALYTGDVLMFIREDLTAGALDLNVATHEYAHGVMRHIASMDGTREMSENAAIAEGIADAFGELSELYFNGSADFVHAGNDLKVLQPGYYAAVPEEIRIASLEDCYRFSTVVSNAVYRMYAVGVDADALSELLFRSVCIMTKHSGFSEWRSLFELAARDMTDAGRLSEEQFLYIQAELDSTGIKAETLYARQVESLEADDVFAETEHASYEQAIA